MSNNKRIIILLIFVISLLSFSSFFTISRFNYKKSLTGKINSKVIKIEFNPDGSDTYSVSQSTTVTVTHKAGINFSALKYVWSTSNDTDASSGTSFTNGDTITMSTDEGEYYLCVYAEDVNGLYNNECSNVFKVDAKAPVVTVSKEIISNVKYAVVEVDENGSGIKSVTNNEGLTLDHIDGNKYYYVLSNLLLYSFTVTDNVNHSVTESIDLCTDLIGTVSQFNFVKSSQEFIASCPGQYVVEAWGSSGGIGSSYPTNISGQGKGAYTKGNVILNANDRLYIYTGEAGTVTSYSGLTKQYGFNGGGYANVRPTDTGGSNLSSGGGSTDIRTVTGNWNNDNSLRSRVMVAAGGAGGSYDGSEPGSGGGLTGYNGVKATGNWWREMDAGYGANQTAPGQLSWSSFLVIGGFGYGGTSSGGGSGGGAGGSGWYGGSGGYVQSGGGGSSYISGHTGCVAVTSTSSSSPKSGCTTGTSNQSCSLSPYGLSFTDTVMIDGAGYSWTTTKGSFMGQPQPDGTILTGRTGNGYARITYLGDNEYHTILLNSDDFDLHGTSIVVGKFYNNLSSIVTPTKTSYKFTGYYSNSDAFDMQYDVSKINTNLRIDLKNTYNDWNLTNADAGTHISAKITVNNLRIPQIDFNDVPVIPYKIVKENNKMIYYIDFDINDYMVTGQPDRGYAFDTNYRFIDLYFIDYPDIAISDITIDHITKGGIKYYNESGESVFPYNKDIKTLYAHKEKNPVTITFDYNYLPNNILNSYYNYTLNGTNANVSSISERIYYNDSAGTGMRITGKCTAENESCGFYLSKTTALEVGKTYTMMADVRSDNSTRSLIFGNEQSNSTRITLSSDWQRVVYTGNVHKAGGTIIFYDWIGDLNNNKNLYIRNMQIQEGNLYTTSKSLKSGKAMGTLESPTRAGWTFDGWYTSPTGGEKIDESTIVPDSNTTYYAHWTMNLVTEDVINKGTFYNGTHTILSNQVNGTAGFELVGRSESGWGSSSSERPLDRDLYIRWDINMDLTNYTKIKYNYRKTANHGRSIVYIRPVGSSLNTVNDEDAYGVHQYGEMTENVWYEEEIDVSNLTGLQTISFVGGYTDYSGSTASTTQYSNIRFIK